MLATTEYDPVGSRLFSTYHFVQGTREFKATAIHHVFTSAHIGQLLVDAGFTDIARFSGPSGDPYELGSGRLLLTARRKD